MIMNREQVAYIIQQAGGLSHVAREIDRWPSIVSEWKRNGRIPPHWVLTMEKLSGVPRYEIRPDLYPHPDDDRAA